MRKILSLLTLVLLLDFVIAGRDIRVNNYFNNWWGDSINDSIYSLPELIICDSVFEKELYRYLDTLAHNDWAQLYSLYIKEKDGKRYVGIQDHSYVLFSTNGWRKTVCGYLYYKELDKDFFIHESSFNSEYFCPGSDTLTVNINNYKLSDSVYFAERDVVSVFLGEVDGSRIKPDCIIYNGHLLKYNDNKEPVEVDPESIELRDFF